MKKLLTSFLLLFTTNLLFAQSLEVSGDSIVYGDSSMFQLESHLYVKNTSSNTVLVYCEKNVVLQNQTGTNNFCWGGTCYGESTFTSTKIDTILSGAQSNGFSGYYQPWNVPSIAKVEYCFYLESDTSDRTCFLVTYDATGASTNIEEVTYSERIGSFYPNPTNKYTNFRYNVKGVSLLQITDILGNVVKNIELEGSREKTIYVGDLHKGIYFGNLVQNGEIVQIKKLIINK
jgi:hypothetical protein